MRLSALSILAVGSVACGVASTPPDTETAGEQLSAARAACTEATRPEVYASMLRAPIKPPSEVGGLVMMNADWSVITLATAEQALCSGTLIPTSDPKEVDDNYYWGNSPEDSSFSLGFNKQDHKLSFWSVGTGYTGKLEFKSRAGSRFGNHTYSVQLGSPILRDGQPLPIDWANEAASQEIATELHDGVIATYAPSLPPEQTNCRTSGRCLLAQLGGDRAVFGVRDVRFYLMVPSTSAGAASSTPSFFYGFPEQPQVHPPPPPTRSADRSALPR